MAKAIWTVVLASLAVALAEPHAAAARDLTFEERVRAQVAIERVFWNHRIWPAENPAPKPALRAVMPESSIRANVVDYLRKSNALEQLWRRPITGAQLQAEMERMARGSQDREMLAELFDALGNDPFVIAETLARQTLAERLLRNRHAADDRFQGAPRQPADQEVAAPDMKTAERANADFGAWWEEVKPRFDDKLTAPDYVYEAVEVGAGAPCVEDTWTPMAGEPSARGGASAVWTGGDGRLGRQRSFSSRHRRSLQPVYRLMGGCLDGLGT